ncbi:programmed cell death protein 7 [Leptodactylus fuscus]|uniref:programmed cell death protein 7 n=1 Tax=Leptodactylus fuscus TaxID=238119 RepID=UPI003F4E6A96
MERRPRPAVNGPWDRPRYRNSSAPRFRHEAPQFPPSRSGSQHGEVHPAVFYPDGGSERSGPWENRPHYEAGQPGSLQRPQHRDERVEFTQHGYREPQQFGPRRTEVFPHGGPRPGLPHHVPVQPPESMANDLYDTFSNDPIIPSDDTIPNIPHHRAPEPPQGTLHNTAPCDGRGPQHMMPATSQHDVFGANQDIGQRLNSQENVYQSGERHHGGPRHEELQDPMYSGRPLPRSEHADAYQPDLFYHSGPSGFRGPNSAVSHYFHDDLPHDRSNLQHPYQDEECQPGMSHGGSQVGLYNHPPVPDNYRVPSPGIQPFSAPSQPPPMQNAPPQGHYRVPPIQGPPYTPLPPIGSGFSGPLEEGDLEVQRHSSHPHHLLNQPPIMRQDRVQALDPLMPSTMAGGRHLEHDIPFSPHELPDGFRDPNLLPQHVSPFVSQHTHHIEDNFMYLDRQNDIGNSGPADKDVFVHWLSSFLSHRTKTPLTKSEVPETYSIAEARELLYGALHLISQLDSLCQVLESRNKAGEPWTLEYEKAAHLQVDLEKKLKELEKPGYIEGVKRKLNVVRRKRLRQQRRRQVTEEEDKVAAERSAEKEASIDLWRMKCIQQVEEKKRERELKATADHVLGEVRKKQNDVKKMLDVLKSLEKLRKLRKEAAGRKGVFPPPSADETFTDHVKRLRTMVHKRSALYDAEEKTLRVILEGEQEEERQREKDKRLKKEKEKALQKQRELDSVLFGDTEPLPGLHPLLPFRQYYLQAEHSVVSLVQIRHEWDQFLVPPDHPDGSNVPRGWVVPVPPSNDTWATAVKQSD